MVSDHQEKGVIPVVLSSSEEYSMYLPVILNAINKNSNQNNNYHFYILDSGISHSSKHVIEAYISSFKHFSIEYIDVKAYIEKYKNLWHLTKHFSVATYIRFFIPALIPGVDKILYLDIDLLIKGDISELYSIDIGEYAVGAAVDACYERETYYDKGGILEYNRNVVCLPDDYKVFNAGVLLINLKKWRELDITEKFIQRLKEIKTPRVLDQCVLNSVFCKGLVYDLPAEWNYQWHADLGQMVYPTTSSKMNEVIDVYNQAKNNIKIIHYTTQTKPWNIYADFDIHEYQLDEEYTPLWWYYARETPFYEKIILNNVKLMKKEIAENSGNHMMPQLNRPSVKRYLFGIIKVKKDQDRKRYYFLGLRFLKKINNDNFKRVYLFNIPIYSKIK